jgi:hypothetical protein
VKNLMYEERNVMDPCLDLVGVLKCGNDGPCLVIVDSEMNVIVLNPE